MDPVSLEELNSITLLASLGVLASLSLLHKVGWPLGNEQIFTTLRSDRQRSVSAVIGHN